MADIKMKNQVLNNIVTRRSIKKYKSEQISRQEQYIYSLQGRFFADYMRYAGERGPELIFYDTYAFYCIKVLEGLSIPAVQINSAVWEPEKYFLLNSWKEYIETVVLPEVPDAPTPDQMMCAAGKRLRAAGRRRIHMKNNSLFFAYHSPGLQNSREALDDKFQYLGFGGGMELYPGEKKESIYVSRGTMADGYDFHLLRQTIEGLSKVGWDIHVSAGGSQIAAERLNSGSADENVHICKFCDQAAMLRTAGAFVCHGGISGVREAIFCETPILVIPANFQDYQVGKALEKAGAGMMLAERPLTAAAVKEKWELFRESCGSLRCGIRKLKREMRTLWETAGVGRLCDLLRL